ncbi:hypothetical protein OH805_17265 [Streptomyces sp. NBC_00879]|uniref:hypothetical protein n=1 Tax=unclassified Streptomyces TaxID=2593676 RepID=UPI003865F9E5|nr:hypothetical protein OHA61_18405 [Streptomyces sp. NBC_00885]WSY75760.1 hypothetical protein OH805_17265 [Streptomyces sp. NBC_00879]
MSKEAREAFVLAHMASGNRHAYDDTRMTFGHPRYEIVARGQVFDGPTEAAAGSYEATRSALPGRRDELVCERVHFGPATVPARLGLVPSLQLPA